MGHRTARKVCKVCGEPGGRDGCGFRVKQARCRRCQLDANNEARRARKAACRAIPRHAPRCDECGIPGGFDGSGFAAVRETCRSCAKRLDDAKQQAVSHARRASDYEPLTPRDFTVGVGNDSKTNRWQKEQASKERRQEWSPAMGEFASTLREGEGDPDTLPEETGGYIARLAEQERRFGNRRIARSVSLAAAHESLALRQFKQAAEQYLHGHITPTGYALREPRKDLSRSVVLLLSDLHLGLDLSDRENPVRFGPVEEARRLEFVIRQALDFKPQYRAKSELVLLLVGDLIEGYLLHDLRDGAPLTEQKVVFWRHFRTIMGLFAAQFPRVRVVCQPGNHGRDTVRHPGRATSSKWDGHEWQMYWALREMCSGLHNVSWDIPQRAVSIIDLHGSKLAASHADTEIKLGDPDLKSEANATTLDRINSSQLYGCSVDVWCFGHWHKPRYIPREPKMLWNGALCPPNGHGRTKGYIGEPCGQWLWEAVEGYPVGDLRFIAVGQEQDRDERLGSLVRPFRFDMEDAA